MFTKYEGVVNDEKICVFGNAAGLLYAVRLWKNNGGWHDNDEQNGGETDGAGEPFFGND